MSANSAENKIKKTLLTPCRQVGLKRKSLGNTPRINPAGQSPCVFNTSVNCSPSTSSTISTVSDITPVRRKNDEILESNLDKKRKLDLLKTKNIFHEPSNNEEEKNENLTEEEIASQTKRLQQSIAEKQAQIDELKSVSANAKQHDLKTLNALIKKWRNGCQAALKELLNEYQKQGKNCSMPLLLKSLGIPTELVHFSEKEMDFTD